MSVPRASATVPGVDQPSAVLAGAGAELDHPVGAADGAQVVLDDDDRVAEVAQAAQQAEQPVGVARVQADRRFVEHVERVHQPRAEGVRERDALGLAARERAGLPVEREIAEADVPQVVDAGAGLGRGSGRRAVAPSRSARGLASQSASSSIGMRRDIGDRLAGDPDGQRLGLEPGAVTGAASCASWYWRRKTRMYCL